MNWRWWRVNSFIQEIYCEIHSGALFWKSSNSFRHRFSQNGEPLPIFTSNDVCYVLFLTLMCFYYILHNVPTSCFPQIDIVFILSKTIYVLNIYWTSSFLFIFSYFSLSFLPVFISSLILPSFPFLTLSFLVSSPAPCRLSSDNPRGFSSGPAEGWGGRRGRRLGVFLPPLVRAPFHHPADVWRTPSLLHGGGNRHHGDPDHPYHPASGYQWNANRCSNNNNSPSDRLLTPEDLRETFSFLLLCLFNQVRLQCSCKLWSKKSIFYIFISLAMIVMR